MPEYARHEDFLAVSAIVGAVINYLAIHPMTQQLEEKQFREQIVGALGPDMIPQFILRVGYLDRYPDPVSPRRPVAHFLVGP